MSHVPDICIVCSSTLKQQIRKAADLSEKLCIPFLNQTDNGYKFHLVYTDNRLELQHNPHFHKYKHSSVSVDFLHNNRIAKRILSSNIKDPLAKAVGIKAGHRPYIVDATAGLGLDGLSLAWLGCEVVLIERSLIIHALLDDGLSRAKGNPRLHKVIRSKISLCYGNSSEIIPQLDRPPATILLDPMYPSQKKRSLNKKEMRLLRDIVGDDEDSSELSRASFSVAENRVVVKRPKGASEIISSPAVSHRIRMKSGRFDVYLKNHL